MGFTFGSLIHFELIFECGVQDKGLTFFFFGMWICSFPITVCWRDCPSLLTGLGIVVKDHLTIYVTVCSWALCFIPLVYLSLCHYHTVWLLWLCSMFFEIRKFESSNFVLFEIIFLFWIPWDSIGILEWIFLGGKKKAIEILIEITFALWSSLVAQRLKRLPPMQETEVQSLGGEDPLKKEMVTHSSILAGESHGRSSLVGYSPRVAKSQTQLSHFTFTFTFHFHIWSVDCFGYYGHLNNIKPSNSEHRVSFHLFVSSLIFFSNISWFQNTNLCSPWLDLFLIILFKSTWNRYQIVSVSV